MIIEFDYVAACLLVNADFHEIGVYERFLTSSLMEDADTVFSSVPTGILKPVLYFGLYTLESVDEHVVQVERF